MNKTTGEWDGMIRSLLVGDVDLVWSVLTVTPERLQVVSFLLPYLAETHCVVMK